MKSKKFTYAIFVMQNPNGNQITQYIRAFVLPLFWNNTKHSETFLKFFLIGNQTKLCLMSQPIGMAHQPHTYIFTVL